MARLFFPLPPAPAAEVVLTGERRHYLVHVLRLVEGASLEVFDGTGRAFDARVLGVDAQQVRLELGPARATPPRRAVSVLQGLPKGDKLEWVLQKGTELGAAAFYPVATARSVVKLEPRRAEERTARWTKIVEEAARQCRRNDVPHVHPPRPLLEAARSLTPGTLCSGEEWGEGHYRYFRSNELIGPEGHCKPGVRQVLDPDEHHCSPGVDPLRAPAWF